MNRPTVGIFGLSGCAGDQLVILDCEDELLDLVCLLDVRDFLMASSDNDETCHLDIAFVEGAVLSRRDATRLARIRERCEHLVAIGTCAVWGGVAAMDRDADRDQIITTLYGETGRTYDTSPAQALHELVEVDCAISGCPIEKEQFLGAVADLLNGNPPLQPTYPVCTECKMRETACLLLRQGSTCLGPITLGGCDARCPVLGIPCVGCRGPVDDANTRAALAMFRELGVPAEAVARKLRTFAPVAIVAAPHGGDR